MELLFEILLQLLGEILLQSLFELAVELGAHALADTLNKPKNVFLSTIGFMLWGAIAGGISLLVLPRSLISNHIVRQMNLLLTPLAVGGLLMLIGRRREKRGQALVGLDRFCYAFVFALAMAVVRYFLAG